MDNSSINSSYTLFVSFNACCYVLVVEIIIEILTVIDYW